MCSTTPTELNPLLPNKNTLHKLVQSTHSEHDQLPGGKKTYLLLWTTIINSTRNRIVKRIKDLPRAVYRSTRGTNSDNSNPSWLNRVVKELWSLLLTRATYLRLNLTGIYSWAGRNYKWSNSKALYQGSRLRWPFRRICAPRLTLVSNLRMLK